jgi:SEC-C motif-containing protein
MRSRYSAFAVGDAGHLLRTWHPSGRPRTLSLDPALRWTRLAVLETRDGGLFDATGTVQFRAMYVQQGQRGVLAETSRFVRQDRHWTYLGPIDQRAPSFRAITLKVPCQTTQETAPCRSWERAAGKIAQDY